MLITKTPTVCVPNMKTQDCYYTSDPHDYELTPLNVVNICGVSEVTREEDIPKKEEDILRLERKLIGCALNENNIIMSRSFSRSLLYAVKTQSSNDEIKRVAGEQYDLVVRRILLHRMPIWDSLYYSLTGFDLPSSFSEASLQRIDYYFPYQKLLFLPPEE